jgi:HEAT repeat protein
MSMRTRLVIAAACLFAVAAGPALAQSPSSKRPAAPTEIAGKKLAKWIDEISSHDPAVREAAIRTVPNFGQPAADNPKTVKALIEILQGDRDIACRVYACLSLSVFGEHLPADSAAKAVEELIRKANPEYETQAIVRLHAVLALGSFGPQAADAIPVLVRRAADPISWEMRQAAILSLASVAPDKMVGPDANAVGALAKILSPANPNTAERSSRVRLAAVMALRILGQPKDGNALEQAREALRRAIKDPDKTVAVWARAGEMVVDPQTNEAVTKERLKGITDCLDDKDVSVKVAAASALGALGRDAEPSIPRIIELLNDPDPVVLATAIDVLAAFKGAAKGAETALRDVMQKKDQREYFQRAAHRALKEVTGKEPPALPPPPPPPTSSSLSKPPDPKEIEGKTLDQWIKEISNRDPSVQEMAMQVVPYFGKKSAAATKALVERTKGGDIACKAHAILALGAIADHLHDKDATEAVKALIEMIDNDQAILRYHAVVALGAFGSKANQAVSALSNRINDPNSWELRMASVSALASVADSEKSGPSPQAVVAIAKRLGPGVESSAQVRMMCVMALGTLGRPADPRAMREAANALTSAWKGDRDKSVQIWSVVALMAVDKVSDKGLDELAKYLKDKDVMTRCTAAQALGAMGKEGKPKWPILIGMLDDKDPLAVATAIDVLAGLGDVVHEAVPALKKLMDDVDKRPNITKEQLAYLKDAAKSAVEKIDGRKK